MTIYLKEFKIKKNEEAGTLHLIIYSQVLPCNSIGIYSPPPDSYQGFFLSNLSYESQIRSSVVNQ